MLGGPGIRVDTYILDTEGDWCGGNISPGRYGELQMRLLRRSSQRLRTV